MSVLDEIRARCEAATPGPWIADDYSHQFVWQKHNIQKGAAIVETRGWGFLTSKGGLSLSDDEAAAIQTSNIEFIAHAREDIPYLIGEIYDLIGKLEKYRRLECDERLIKLPIRPGTTVWVLETKADHKTQFVRERIVNSYRISTDEYIYMQLMVPEGAYSYPVDDIYLEVGKVGKRVFLDKEAAETALTMQEVSK